METTNNKIYFYKDEVMEMVKEKTSELKELRKELKQLGFKLSFNVNTRGYFYIQLNSETDYTNILFNGYGYLNIKEKTKKRKESNRGSKEYEYALYETMKYIAGVLNLDEIRASHYQHHQTFWYNYSKNLFTFSQENEQKQAMYEQTYARLEEAVQATEVFQLNDDYIKDNVFTFTLRNKIFNQRFGYTMDFLVEENTVLLNDEAYTVEEVIAHLTAMMEESIKKGRIKLLFDQNAQENLLKTKGFDFKQAKMLLHTYEFQVASELTIVSSKQIDFLKKKERGISETSGTISVLSNGDVLTYSYYYGSDCKLYSSMEEFLSEQRQFKEIYFQKYIEKLQKEMQENIQSKKEHLHEMENELHNLHNEH